MKADIVVHVAATDNRDSYFNHEVYAHAHLSVGADRGWDGDFPTPKWYHPTPVLRAQTDARSDHFYGWEIGYETVTHIRLLHAEAMVRCLRHIDRKMQKQRDKFGYPQSTEQWVRHFVEAVGAKFLSIQDYSPLADKDGCTKYPVDNYSICKAVAALNRVCKTNDRRSFSEKWDVS